MSAERVGKDTLLGQIVNMVAEAQRNRAPIEGLADKVAGIFGNLQLITPNDQRKPRRIQLEAIPRGLRRLAKELDCVVLLLCQLNADAEGNRKGKTVTAELSESGDRIRTETGTYLAKYRDGDGLVCEVATGCIDRRTRRTERGCEFFELLVNSVAFCSAKVALMDAAFAERKATLKNSQPQRAQRSHCALTLLTTCVNGLANFRPGFESGRDPQA